MADKKATGFIKLQIQAGQANPAPPVGPALGAQGVNIMQFCQAFNAETKDKGNTIIPVEITVYEDKSFSFICKTPPAAVLIKEKLRLNSGSGIPHVKKVGQLTEQQLREIAEVKMPDLNANTIEGRAPKTEYVITKKLAALLSGKSAEEAEMAAAPAPAQDDAGAAEEEAAE